MERYCFGTAAYRLSRTHGPVERFFEELRKPLSNKIFQTIEDVEDFLSTLLIKYWQHPETLIQLCHYPHLRSD
jgi:hypothetical protein